MDPAEFDRLLNERIAKDFKSNPDNDPSDRAMELHAEILEFRIKDQDRRTRDYRSRTIGFSGLSTSFLLLQRSPAFVPLPERFQPHASHL
jgi:hypothetical protein